MELKEFLMVLPSLLVILGWFTVNWLTSIRDCKAKNREIRYSYLSKAHKSISAIAHRDGDYTELQRSDFEGAMEDIQIFGSESQIKVLKNVLSSDDKDFNKVILSLRNEMRSSLGLKGNNTVLFYRVK